jgi:hypothetical protein
MKKIAQLFPLVLFVFITAAAATTTVAQEKTEWMRVVSDNGEFSVEVPANYTYFYDRDGFSYQLSTGTLQYAQMQMLNASQEKTVMSVEIYKVSSPKKHLNHLLDKLNHKTSKKDAPEDFIVKEFERNSFKDRVSNKDIEISFFSRYIASKTHLYIVTVANRGSKTAAFERFLSSVQFSGGQTGGTKISSLKALTIENIGENVTDQPKQNAPPNQPQSVEQPKNPTPVLVISKPLAGYTSAARDRLTTGVIRLRATLDKTGRVSKIGFVSGLPDGLNRSAFFAALRIKFIPEEKDGEAVTVTKTFEYTFSIG